MDLSGLSAIAPGYLEGQAQQAQTAINQNTAQSPAALAALLQALGVSQGPAGLGRPLAAPQVQPGGAPPPQGGPAPSGAPPDNRFDRYFSGNDTPSQMAPGGPDMGKFDWMFSGNGMAPQPGYGRYQVLQPQAAPPPSGGAGPAGLGQPSGAGGGAASPPQPAAAPPNLPPQTKQALYQMPLQDIVAAVKKGNPNIDDRTLGLGLQALAPFLNRQAQLDLQEQRLAYTQEINALRQQNTEQRIDQAWQRLDPATQASLAGARVAGGSVARTEPAAGEAIRFIDNAIATSAAVPREQWKAANQLIQAGESQLNDPKLAALHAALWGVVNTYTAAIAAARGRAPTVNDKKHAEGILSAVQDQPAFEAAANMLKYEVQIAQQEAQRNVSRTTGRPDTSVTPAAPNVGASTEIDDLVKKYGG